MECGQHILYPWGTLWPIYSPSKRRIYKNIACSNCHDVTDGVAWNASLGCRNIVDLLHIDHILDSSLFSSTNSSCDIDFSYAEREDDILSQKCFISTISRCTNSRHWDWYAGRLDVSVMEVGLRCTEGLFTPVLYGNKWYRNKHCASCNSDYAMFPCQFGEYGNDFFARPFIGIMDSRFTSLVIKEESKIPEKQACLPKSTVSLITAKLVLYKNHFVWH